MLKNLVTVLAFATPAIASAETRVYDVRATRPADEYRRDMSCDATERMLKDKHIIVFDDDGSVTVNGLRWKSLTEEPDLLLAFHNSHNQKTFLVMDLYVSQRGISGKYTLVGAIPDVNDPRKYYVCTDTVYLDGNRR